MKVARVMGSIWATRQTEGIEALPMQLIVPLDANSLEVLGEPIAAVNTVGAGPGDIVFYVEAYEACLPLPNEMVPIDASIVGIIEMLGDEPFLSQKRRFQLESQAPIGGFMQLCRVIKSAVATVKNNRLGDCKILVCQPVDLDGTSPLGPSFLAWDRVVKAGAGELVLVVNEGSSARLVFGDRKIPLTAFVAAVVDALDLSDENSLLGSSVVERSRSA